jgi:hypothetical protein
MRQILRLVNPGLHHHQLLAPAGHSGTDWKICHMAPVLLA